MNKTHAFVICAYKKSPYLESCIRSLRSQTVRSDIYLVTSTPSEYIDRLAAKYRIPVAVRHGASSLKEDWLFGWRLGGMSHSLVTIAHQDDKYHPKYVEKLLEAYRRYPDMTVFCSDYVVLKTKEETLENGTVYPVSTKMVSGDMVRLVKKVLRLPLCLRWLSQRAWVKKLPLLFGNSICCPSCTYNHDRIGNEMFRSDMEFALDWDNLYELAMKPGRFICSEMPLMAYRVHDGATTKACIEDQRRSRDEIAMFRKMWPEWMVRILMRYYRKAYQNYIIP